MKVIKKIGGRRAYRENQKARAEILKMNIQGHLEFTKTYMNNIMSVALNTLRGAFLLNGAAAIAALSNQNIVVHKPEIIFLCAFGAAFALVSAGFTYMSEFLSLDFYARTSYRKIYKALGINVSGEEERGSGAVLCQAFMVLFFVLSVMFFLMAVYAFKGYMVMVTKNII